jgi:site-specific DNA recombinase
LERPALQRLLADIAQRRVDTVVVYKVDRLTRSLMDFAKIVEAFDRYGVTLVAITQQFNTTTSMGRLTLNILLSFAQLEREVIGERVRDKIAASKKKGMWMGGTLPLGYTVSDRKLVIVLAEAETVGWSSTDISNWARCGCCSSISTRDRSDQSSAGREMVLLRVASRFHGERSTLLSNPTYVGEIGHKGARYPGQHAAILDREVWERAEAQLRSNSPDRKPAPGPAPARSWESSLTKGERGSPQERDRDRVGSGGSLPPTATGNGAIPISDVLKHYRRWSTG